MFLFYQKQKIQVQAFALESAFSGGGNMSRP